MHDGKEPVRNNLAGKLSRKSQDSSRGYNVRQLAGAPHQAFPDTRRPLRSGAAEGFGRISRDRERSPVCAYFRFQRAQREPFVLQMPNPFGQVTAKGFRLLDVRGIDEGPGRDEAVRRPKYRSEG